MTNFQLLWCWQWLMLGKSSKSCRFSILLLGIMYETSIIYILVIVQVNPHLCKQSGGLRDQLRSGSEFLAMASPDAIGTVANSDT